MILKDIFHKSWYPILATLNQEPLLTLNTTVLSNCLYYPPKASIFRVFRMPLEEIKVVILGQDPYHGPGQANGLCFAVNENISFPPSLKVIYKELEQENLINQKLTHTLNEYAPKWRTLKHWEEQGVFLLNTTLTVQSGMAGSHLHYWENFTKNVINFISMHHPCIWLLWGTKAHAFTANMPPKSIFNVDKYNSETIQQIPINGDYNYILKAAHPAAECYRNNAGFYGCNHFLFANTVLSKLGKTKINW